jgi:hypothetical protein
MKRNMIVNVSDFCCGPIWPQDQYRAIWYLDAGTTSSTGRDEARARLQDAGGMEGTMRGLRNLQKPVAICGLILGLGGVAWAQDNSGQNGTSPTQPVNRPIKPPPIGDSGADSSGPFKAQSGGGMQGINPQSQSPVSPNVNGPADPQSTRLEQDQAKMRNLDRQKKLVDDTAKLVSLANELKADVEKSNKDTLSLDVIRKADEIEKLARSVKEKMKGS